MSVLNTILLDGTANAGGAIGAGIAALGAGVDRKSTRLNSSH